jgi:hypothetical protein
MRSDRARRHQRRRAASTRWINSSMTGLVANGTKRTGAQNATWSPKMLGRRNDSTTRGGFTSGE